MNDRIVSDELVYRGRVVDVHAVDLERPDGSLQRRDLLRYPQAVVILPILDDSRVVLIQNDRYAVDERLLELPAGGIDPGETPEQAAPRELAEETGYTAGSWEKLGSFVTCPGTSDEVMHAFVARDLSPGDQDLQAGERIRVELVEMAELRRRMLDGRLHDGKTMATLGLYWLGCDEKPNRMNEG
ncbi:MAG: NUDIX hydrolase [Phycisphaerae bacterium]